MIRTVRIFALLICCAAPLHRAVAQPYNWQISGIEVLDAEGAAFALPFLGGFNVPRPQLVDIDDDGDQDLFVQEKSGQIMFFAHLGAEAVFPFAWQTDAFEGLDVGEWYRFTDLDGDGDFDLLAEQPFSLMRYFRNDGSARAPEFTLLADTLFDDQGEALFADRQNIPNVTDIDCDGRADLFVGRLDGTIRRYELLSFDAQGVPLFTLEDERFQDIEIVAESAGKQSDALRHGANTLTFTDLDADGDQDLLWGDFFETGLLYLENAGSCEVPDFSIAPAAFPPNAPLETSGYNAPTIGDVTGDGIPDLVVGVLGGAFSTENNTANNLFFFEGINGTEMEPVSERYLSNLDFGSDSYPVLQDLDGDGDFDLIVANSIDPENLETAVARVLENRGTPLQPAFQFAGSLPLAQAFNYAPAFGDLDANGVEDMLVGSWQGEMALYTKTGDGLLDFELADAALLDIPGGSNTTPSLVDIDGDGDLDVVAGEANGSLNYFENTGTAASPDFAAVVENWLGIDAGRRSVPVFRDLDGDGDLDLLLASDQDGLQFYGNTGTVEAPAFQPDVPLLDLTEIRRIVPALADLDADGDLDLLSGTLQGGLLYFENDAVASSTEKPGVHLPLLMELYPNPFSGKAVLEMKADAPLQVEAVIYDLTGRQVMAPGTHRLKEGNGRVEINLVGQPAGVYFLRLRLENGAVYTRPLIHRP